VRSLPDDRLNYVVLSHLVPVWADVNFELSGSVTNVQPGYLLESLDVRSKSTNVSGAFSYQIMRTRQENLSTKLKFDARDTKSNTLGIEITHDIVRALRVGVDYDLVDSWLGYNVVNLTVSQGLDAFGADRQNSSKLSRAEAKPTFRKLEFSLARLQRVNNDWSFLARTSGQLASGALYSAEEFGYGGQAYGRAFDASELIGDQGINGSLELRYDALNQLEPFSFQPFAFYDAGVVTNFDTAQSARQTASSVGAGVRFNTKWDQSGNLTVAVPVGAYDAATPIYGFNPSGPRISFQFTQRF